MFVREEPEVGERLRAPGLLRQGELDLYLRSFCTIKIVSTEHVNMYLRFTFIYG